MHDRADTAVQCNVGQGSAGQGMAALGSDVITVSYTALVCKLLTTTAPNRTGDLQRLV